MDTETTSSSSEEGRSPSGAIITKGWDRYDYGGGSYAFQRACAAPACDRGMLYAPARFCPACGGTGFEVVWVGTPR